MLTNDDDATSSSHTDRAPNRSSRQETSKGTHLYEVLGVEKTATDDDIKRAYRKLALRYHPDKNLDGDPDKTEIFKEINHANTVLSNPQKRKIYDEYGEMGLKLLEQFGDDDTIMKLAFKPWFKWTFVICGLLTCCCFGCCCGCMCCCQCCCNFCCGKYRPKPSDAESENVDFNDSNGNGRHTTAGVNDLPNGHDVNFTPIIVEQPTFGGGNASPIIGSRHHQRTPSPPHRPAVIAMPPPPSTVINNGSVAESTALESSPISRNYGSTVISIETNT